ncbi:MAG: DUF7133 domain-containing protein [Limisphaerales bacterium]
MNFQRICSLVVLLTGCLQASAAEDPFKMLVRPTEPLSPGEQLKKFRLPKGFEIQLVASEPNLRKPMNMAFDSSGRLWVTESREYPRAAPTNSRPRDTIRIFSDFDQSGFAQRVTTFATNLNIPIGIYPFRTVTAARRVDVGSAGRPNATAGQLTWKCVVWSIPNIIQLEDRDGNGAADTSKILYGPFDHTRDTHGNQASFRRGQDGWLYATHGFNNRSEVAGTDGHSVQLHSGNTYRMKLDGSRIEQWTHGQVNPFGLCSDMFGNFYSADCHSSPIYQLIRGAYYPSFGKPHDGLGFGPTTITHSHGSTAIAGIVMIDDPAWPFAYRGNLMIGNVMTSGINRDRVDWFGTTTKGVEMDDFLKCDDPWFRPVDLQWGPDGALYVADFYNRIIGHYEVPLDHAGRDRERGRIWRIVYRGDGKKNLDSKMGNLMAALGSSNPTKRLLALQEICDVYGRRSVRELLALLRSGNEHHHVGALWALHRLNVLSERNLLAATIAKTTLPRVHGMRIASEWKRWSPNLKSIITKSLNAENAYIRRAAAEALGLRTNLNTVGPLLMRLRQVREEDTHTRHAIRIAVRNQLQTGGAGSLDPRTNWPPELKLDLAEISLAVKTPAAAGFVLRANPNQMRTADLKNRAWEHVAQYALAGDLAKATELIRSGNKDDVDTQLKLFEIIRRAFDKRGEKLTPNLQDWGNELAGRLLSKANLDRNVWGNLPPNSTRHNANPWSLQERKCADGKKVKLLSSHPHGERLRGRLRSRIFELPDTLEFYLCGHSGKPGEADLGRNIVRLRLANGRIIQSQKPPRHDTAKLITWDLKEFAGQEGYVEASDGDASHSYAWMAFGRFQPALSELRIVDVARQESRMIAAAKFVQELKLTAHKSTIANLLADRNGGLLVRKEAAATLASLSAGGLRWAGVNIVGDQRLPERLRDSIADALAAGQALGPLLEQASKSSAHDDQLRLAFALAGVTPGAELLLQLVDQGLASPRVLQNSEVETKLQASAPKELTKRLARLTKDLPAADESRGRVIAERIADYRANKGIKEAGRSLFDIACAACHQVNGKGGLVGPQLDGIGARGLERVVEDILNPHRNVDVAFRAETITLKNGESITGLPRREEGATLVVADSAGKEQTVKLDEIAKRTTTARSLMPDNFHEAMVVAQMRDLLSYLLTVPAR